MVDVYCENHMKPISKNVDLVTVKGGGMCSYHRSLEGGLLSIVSEYKLFDRGSEVSSPAETKDFSSSLCVLTSS
jgi:hypothetical protein